MTLTGVFWRREGGMDKPHPDNSKNTKLCVPMRADVQASAVLFHTNHLRPYRRRWLCRLREHLGLPQTRELWVWFDIFSVP